jgi:hypothetical protein
VSLVQPLLLHYFMSIPSDLDTGALPLLGSDSFSSSTKAQKDDCCSERYWKQTTWREEEGKEGREGRGKGKREGEEGTWGRTERMEGYTSKMEEGGRGRCKGEVDEGEKGDEGSRQWKEEEEEGDGNEFLKGPE